MIRLQVFKEVKTHVPRKKLDFLLETIVSAETNACNFGQVNLVLTSDKRIKELNRQYRAIDESTDVLSFELGRPANPDDTFGEIYISVPMARRQAKRYRTSLSDETLRLFCHGMLHLFGYDHFKSRDAKKMKARENYFLKQLKGRL